MRIDWENLAWAALFVAALVVLEAVQ